MDELDLDPRIFDLLKSKDPEDRKRAVKALAQIPSNESLRYLATIYKKDPDESVRDLAIQAGKHVKKIRAAGDWLADKDAKLPAKDTPVRRSSSVPAVNQEQSKGLMSKALDEVVKSNFDKAEELARKAFALNPDLQYDSYYAGVASDIMGMEVEEAIAALLTPDEGE